EFDNQITMNAILYVLHTGIQWNMLPEKYCCHTTIHGKFMKWCRLGIFKKMMTKAREYYRKRNKKIIGMPLIQFQEKLLSQTFLVKTQQTEQSEVLNMEFLLIEKELHYLSMLHLQICMIQNCLSQ